MIKPSIYGNRYDSSALSGIDLVPVGISAFESALKLSSFHVWGPSCGIRLRDWFFPFCWASVRGMQSWYLLEMPLPAASSTISRFSR